MREKIIKIMSIVMITFSVVFIYTTAIQSDCCGMKFENILVRCIIGLSIFFIGSMIYVLYFHKKKKEEEKKNKERMRKKKFRDFVVEMTKLED